MLHQAEPPGIQQSSGLGGQRTRDHDDVGLGQQLLEPDVLDARLRAGGARCDDHTHAPGREKAHDLMADPAVADHSEGASDEAPAKGSEAALPPIALV